MKERAEAIPGAAFWREAFALHGSATLRVLPRTLLFAGFAALVAFVHRSAPWIRVREDAVEGAGVVLGLLLVFRSAAGYERWWEARSLWGGIVNQSRNLVIAAVAYGSLRRAWHDDLARWVAVFAHVTRGSLRDERGLPEVVALLGSDEAARIAATRHMPSYVSARVAALLRTARDGHQLDSFAYLQIDRERVELLNHAGGCERILGTPIPRVYSVVIRRFIVLYLGTLALALAESVGYLSPVYMVLLAYPILSLEQIGAELQNPFVTRSLSHLNLARLCENIERDVLAAAEEAGE